MYLRGGKQESQTGKEQVHLLGAEFLTGQTKTEAYSFVFLLVLGAGR